MVIAVHVGVVVAAVFGNGPFGIFAFHIDLCPAVPILFPVLIEDDDEVVLDHIFGADNGAVIVAFLLGVGPEGHALVDGDGFFVFLPRTVFRIKAVIDGGVSGGASDGHVLGLIVGTCTRCENRCCHCRSGRDAAFALHEDVEEEVVLAVGHVAGGIGLHDALGISHTQCHGTGVGGGVDDVESEVFRYQAFRSRDACGNRPDGLLTVQYEVGAAVAVTNHVAVGIGEGVAVGGDVDSPVIAVLIAKDAGGDDFIATVHLAGELGGGEFAARRGVGDGEVGVGRLVVTGGEDDAVASHKSADIADAHVVVARHRLCSDVTAAGHFDVIDIGAGDGDVFVVVFTHGKTGFQADIDDGAVNGAIVVTQRKGALGSEVVA